MRITTGRVPCLAIALLFSPVNTLFAQFHYNKIKDQSGLEFQKSFEFYAAPRFNRVEGLFFHGGVNHYPQKLPGFHVKAEAGWGGWNEAGKEFRFFLGARHDMMGFERLSVGLDIFRQLGSMDNWVISEVENSVNSFFLRDDYADYYGDQGVRFYVDKKITADHTARIEVTQRKYDNLQRNINWSLFGGAFQDNPIRSLISPITLAEGNELSVRFITSFDFRDNPIFPVNGWHITTIYERTFQDFKTDGLFIALQRYQQTFGNQRYSIRAMLGSRSGSLAQQHTIGIGGVGTLRGYKDKEYIGNRMVMLNVDYKFGGELAQKIPLTKIPGFDYVWPHISLGAFVDTGWVGRSQKDVAIFKGFKNFSFQSDIGLSLFILDGIFRLNLARRLRSIDGANDYRFTFRILEVI